MVKKTSTMILVAVSLMGCCTPDVSAEKATFDVIEPAHREYIKNDPFLDAAKKQRRYRLLDSWKIRIDAQMAAQGGK